ncbi:RHS repeat-associated core domain-containing protein [Candidatus Protochlamydia sp. R18]|uniref:RHS repeat-associated core domain-containing protein n=1 Tax=Candidatus Protochlamydia sp. R18 TaxID=1353977 RepID=UPI0005A5D185|nr:RHS repeat-associated core domain-containing protein [Candidatus Protochlamydia sp. R18]
MNNIRFVIFFIFSLISLLEATDPSVPTPLVNSINVISGHLEGTEPPRNKHEFYTQGINRVNNITVNLPRGDFRIGRVKAQVLDEEKGTCIYFFYQPGLTEIIDQQARKTIYRYSNNLIQSVEQYQASSGSSDLYRQEKFFWKTDLKIPLISSRVLADEKGQAIHCTQFSYNDQGQLIRQTLYGNLSGSCSIPLIIQADGVPSFNGIESYSSVYRYYPSHPDLIWMVREDNGATTTYHYDFKTKRCEAKLQGNQAGLLSRTFYCYDDLGLLCQTILDDGQNESATDLKGVTHRRIINIQSCRDGIAFSQPLMVENKYFDLLDEQEKLLDRTRYTYSSEGKLLQQNFYDADDNLRYHVSYHYDEEGHLKSTEDSRGEIVEAPSSPFQDKFDEEGHRISSVDSYGNETAFEYDSFGRLIKTHLPTVLDEYDNPVQLKLEQFYDISDQVIEMKDAEGGITKTSYTARGKPSHIQYPNGLEEIYVYHLDGELKEKINKNRVKTSFIRDLSGRISRVEEKLSEGFLIRALNYSYLGNLVSTITDEKKDHIIRFEYDGAGRQIRSLHETADGTKRIEWFYDACGQRTETREWFSALDSDFVTKIEEKDAWQQTVATRLEDSQGSVQQRIKHSFPKKETLFLQESVTQNQLGQYVKLTETIDENGVRDIKIYDALNRLESCLQINSLGEKIRGYQVRYNKSGKKVSEKHQIIANGKDSGQYIIKWDYDEDGKLVAIHEAAGSFQQKITRYQYHESGKLATVIKPDGKQIHYYYDENNLLSSYQASDNSFAYRYQYDQNKRLIAIEDLVHQGIQTRQYNAFDQVIEENLGKPETTLSFDYDLAGRKTKIDLPDNSSIHYRYEGSLLTSVERYQADRQLHYHHDYFYEIPSGKVQKSHLIKDVGVLSYYYDEHDRLQKTLSPWWSETFEQLDQKGRLMAVTIKDSLNTYSQTYQYSEDHQLIEETGDGELHHTYQYDSLFNRLKFNSEQWKTNSLNQLIETPLAFYRYDLNGNLVEKKGKESVYYEYDALNRLIRVSTPNDFAIHFIYDSFDRCLQKQNYHWDADNSNWILTDSNFYLFDGQKEIGCLNTERQLTQLRVLGIGKGAEINAAVALELNNKIYAPIHDHQGSVRCLIDTETKEVAEFYRYSAFGSESIYNTYGEKFTISQIENSWRFSSKRIEEKTGLIGFGKRYYDSTIGRWITPDPLFFYDTPNLYTFVRNDSINHYDLYGLFSISEIWDSTITFFFDAFRQIQTSAHRFKIKLHSELKLPESFANTFEKINRNIFGNTTYILMGHSYEKTEINTYGENEISDKVRVTFINGILTTYQDMLSNLELISESHGGVKVHYIFRPTEGWTWDVSRAIMVKLAFNLGFRSMHAHLLAAQWRSLIHEMGGVSGGGTIIHYAHSLGGTETERARDLLTPEEQKMIRVISFGSATLIPNNGFQSVKNIVSVNDGVSTLFEPFGHFRNYFDPDTNVQFQGDFSPLFWGGWPGDHFLSGPTYSPFIQFYGKQFLAEFAPT